MESLFYRAVLHVLLRDHYSSYKRSRTAPSDTFLLHWLQPELFFVGMTENRIGVKLSLPSNEGVVCIVLNRSGGCCCFVWIPNEAKPANWSHVCSDVDQALGGNDQVMLNELKLVLSWLKGSLQSADISCLNITTSDINSYEHWFDKCDASMSECAHNVNTNMV